MHKSDEESRPEFSRRAVLATVGGSLASLPLLALGCGASPQTTDAATGADADALDGGGLDALEADAGLAWATGGTAAMVGAAAYPDPFEADLGSTCELHCTTTIGPCHTTSPERSDVSDGWDGLPVRLALKLVDESCTPLEDYIVEIWSTNHNGIYSGEISTMCNTEEEDRSAEYFRGYLRSDADGRVDFDTVFPGWYSGRSIHIHFRIMAGAYDAADNAGSVVVSQLFFPEETVESIFSSEPLYAAFGQPDTPLATDNVIGGEEDPSKYICAIARMDDGAMMASKTLVVKLAGSDCSVAGGAGGPGGPGMMPPGM